MGIQSAGHTMVATKLLISLCVAGLARASPQLLLTGPARANQQVIVSDVVTALQPSIAQAVAEALRGLGGSSRFTSSSSSTGFASGGSSFGSSSGSNFGSSSAAGGFSAGAVGAVGAIDEGNAQYNYEFKVADEGEQTYITQNEARDGNEVTGTYSYVDPNGDLVTVNYQAGPMGYTQTLDKQVGVVNIVQKPVRNQASSQSGSSFGSQSGSSFGSQSGSSFGSQSGLSSTSFSSSGLSQSALIAQIIAALEPQISVAVNNAVGSRQ